MTTHELLRSRIHAQAGLITSDKPKLDLARLKETEWSSRFELLMRARMVFGALRYSTISKKKIDAAKGKHWDILGAVKSKLVSYEQTGNTEYLVDAANYLMLAFECDPHPTKHFYATDNVDHAKLK